jgi:hypothetical protein
MLAGTSKRHEVTAVVGESFPPCNHCGDQIKFILIKAATHLKNDEVFRK